jgi:phosphoglycolate phosphatase-like HAD superfamily hydrolase
VACDSTLVQSAARYLGRRRAQRQAAQEAQNTSDAEAAAAALKQQLQEETMASAEAVLRADHAAARNAEACATLLQQMQHAFEQQQSSKVRADMPT